MIKLKFVKPNIVISRCIEFCSCRYNAEMIHSSTVNDLKEFVNFITVCPEVDIGMSIPRKSVRIVEYDNKRLLIQPGTEEDYSERMYSFSENFLNNLNKSDIEGILLKTSSPSCRYKDTKVYKTLEKGSSIRKNSSGFFTEKAEQIFPNVIFETEGRLENFIIREEFYTKIFISAMLKEVLKSKKIKDLIDFHSKNKYLFMSYSQEHLKKMGNIVANRIGKNLDEIYNDYKSEFNYLIKKSRKNGNNINVLLHIFGYFSEKITKDEKEFFLEKIEQYKEKMVPFSLVVSILESWTVRFNEEYLKNQTIFNPFPKKLIKVTDSGKGREM